MRLETHDDVMALSPLEALTLGCVGDSHEVRAERASIANRLIDQFGYETDAAGRRVVFPQYAIVEHISFHDGSMIAALHRLERDAGRYEADPAEARARRSWSPPLTSAQARELRDQVLAPMPQPAPRAQVDELVAAHVRIDTLRDEARHGQEPVGAARDLSIATRSFENTFGFPPGEDRPVVALEQYLAAGEEASGRAVRVGMAAAAAQQAVTQAGNHFARVAEHEAPSSARFQVAERSLERLRQIQDRINVSSYAGWGVDGVTLDRQERVLREADQVRLERAERGIDVEDTTLDETTAYYEVGAVFDGLAISRAAQGQVNIVEPVFGTDQEPAVRLEGPAPRVGQDEAQETVVVRRSTDGQMATDIETSGPGANDDTARYNVTDRAELARALGVDGPTAIATVAVAYGELERTRAHLDQDMRADLRPQEALGESRVMSQKDYEKLVQQDQARAAEVRAAIDRGDINEATEEMMDPSSYLGEFNQSVMHDSAKRVFDVAAVKSAGTDRVAVVELGHDAKSVELEQADAYGFPLDGASRVDVNLSDTNAVTVDVWSRQGPPAQDVELGTAAHALGLDEDQTRATVLQAAHQLRRARADFYYPDPSAPDAGVDVDQQDPDALRWAAASTRDPETDQRVQNDVITQTDHAEDLVADAAALTEDASFAAAGTASPADDVVADDRAEHVAQAQSLVREARVSGTGGAGITAAHSAMRSAASVQRTTTRLWDDMAAEVEAQTHDRPTSAAARLPRSADRTDYRPSTQHGGPSVGWSR